LEANITNLSIGQLVRFVEKAANINLGVTATILDKLFQISINNLYVLVSPQTWNLGFRTIPQGFHIKGDGRILGADVRFNAAVVQRSILLPIYPAAVNINDFQLSFNLTDLNLLNIVGIVDFTNFVMEKVGELVQKFSFVCSLALCPNMVSVPETCLPQECLPDICTPQVCTPQVCAPQVCSFGICTPGACVGGGCVGGGCISGACSPRVCVPGFNIPGICPTGACANITNGVLSVLNTIRSTVANVLVIKELSLDNFSLYDFITSVTNNDVGPKLHIKVIAMGTEYESDLQTNLSFFITNTGLVPLPAIQKYFREQVQYMLKNPVEEIAFNVVKSACNALSSLSINIGGTNVNFPNLC